MEPNPYQPPSDKSPPLVDPENRPTEAGAVAFGVALRVMAIFCLIYGGWNMVAAVLYFSGMAIEAAQDDMKFWFANGDYFIVVGLALLWGAPLLVRLNYFVKRNRENDEDDS